jgi:hypothetical protein
MINWDAIGAIGEILGAIAVLLNERLDDIFERGCREPKDLNTTELRQFDYLVHQLLMNIRVRRS